MSNTIPSIRILPADVESVTRRPGSPDSGFVDTLRTAMDDLESVQAGAEHKVSELVEGNGSDVHSAMIAVEKAELSFQLMMQVRNKIVQAYQEISRMQF